MSHGMLVNAVCARCGTALAPALGGRLRCPRLSACGFGGIVEDAAAIEVFRLTRVFERAAALHAAPLAAQA